MNLDGLSIADGATLEFTVDIIGVHLNLGWYYDAVLNAVVFDPDYLPDEGDTITIVYNELLGC